MIRLVTAVLLGAMVGSACRPSGPLRPVAVQMGRSLNSDHSVGNHTTSFKPGDTMNLAVLTSGPGSGVITVRWLYAGRLVTEQTREVSYRDDAATDFHIQNSGGFPVGAYAVEVIVDGEPYVTRPLRVDP